MTSFIVFSIIGMVEVSPNVCKVDYMRYVDVSSVTIPCDILKNNQIKPIEK